MRIRALSQFKPHRSRNKKLENFEGQGTEAKVIPHSTVTSFLIILGVILEWLTSQILKSLHFILAQSGNSVTATACPLKST